MLPYQIISKKRDRNKLSQEELEFFIHGFVKGEIPDYQVSALLMAIFLNGMDEQETLDLTLCLMRSGRILNLKSIPGIKVDKHSTGGVGDKVSLVLAPWIASCGVVVPLISGRGLGHTGGTLDKLASIPGFNTDISLKRFVFLLAANGLAMIGQTNEIAPADGKLYALRDVTATVNSIPLIAASIVSKKLAVNSDAIVFDVKVGNGALMSSREDALKLAHILVRICHKMNKKSIALITDMNEPLGHMVGNSLEVIEAIECLKGNAPEDLVDVCLGLGSQMLILGKRAKSQTEAIDILKKAMQNGSALKKFKQMVRAQGGDERVIDDYNLLPQAKYVIEVKSTASGWVKSIDTSSIGLLGVEIGAGRRRIEDKVQLGVGFSIKTKVGDYIEKGQALAKIFINDLKKGKEISHRLRQAFVLSSKPVRKLKKILYLVNNRGAREL
jgi:pyrimidine-nucleoside phosphorylase